MKYKQLINKTLIISMLFVGGGMLNACKKDEAPVKEQAAINKDLGYCIEEGMLKFKSGTGFFNLIDSLNQLTPKQRIAWEQNIGFKSLKTKIDSLRFLVANACSEDEYYQVYADNEQFITLTDEGFEPKIQNPIFGYVINTDGMYAVNDTYVKINALAMKHTSAENLTTANLNFNTGVNVENIAHDQPKLISNLKSTNVTCGNEFFDDDYNKEGDRYVSLKIEMHLVRSPISGCYYDYQQYYRVRIEAKKKKWLSSKFDLYATNIHHKGIQFSYNELYTNDNAFKLDYNEFGCYLQCQYPVYGSVKTKTYSDNSWYDSDGWWEDNIATGHSFQNNKIEVSNFKKIKGRAWTQGTTHNRYAEFCCNYTAPCIQ